MEIIIVTTVAITLLVLTWRFVNKFLLRIKYRRLIKIIQKLDPNNCYYLGVDHCDMIDAYAKPNDGRKEIIISKGSLKFFTIPEITFVLAHEIAHYQLGHLSTMRLYSKIFVDGAVEAARPKGFLESIGFTSMKKEPPLWWQIITKGLEVYNYQTYQNDEYAADKRGVILMEQVGVNRKHAISALSKLKILNPDKSGFEKIISTYFGKRSHPFLVDRIAKISRL